MKTAIVPASALQFGWEPKVLMFASDYNIKIESKEDYQNLRELMKLIKDIDHLTMKQADIKIAMTAKRKRRDQLKLKLGWGKNRKESKDGVPEL